MGRSSAEAVTVASPSDVSRRRSPDDDPSGLGREDRPSGASRRNGSPAARTSSGRFRPGSTYARRRRGVARPSPPARADLRRRLRRHRPPHVRGGRDRGNRWAGSAARRGLVPGDRVLVLVGKRPEWHAVVLGALKAGLVTVPCSDDAASDASSAFRGEHSERTLVVADREGAAELAPRWTCPSRSCSSRRSPPSCEGCRRCSRRTTQRPTTSPSSSTRRARRGDPKGAVHTHAYTWASRLQAEHWLDARPGDLVWCTRGHRLGEVDLERPARAVVVRGRDRDPRGRLRRRATLRSPAAARRHGALPDADRVPADGEAPLARGASTSAVSVTPCPPANHSTPR